MPTGLTVNGTTYQYPVVGDQQWGSAATNWAIAVTNGMLQKAGGNFTLTADVNFGASFGLISQYFTSRSSNAAASGVVRLASGDSLGFRNNANSGDILLGKNSSDQLTWGGVAFIGSNGALIITGAELGMTTLGDLIYGGASGALTRLAGQTSSTKNFLTQTGTGSVSAAPAWGTIASADLPTIALTGDVTGSASAGSIATTIAAGAVTNSKMANMATHTIKGNNTGSGAAPLDLTIPQLTAMFSAPTLTKLTAPGTTSGWLFTISTSTTCAVGDTYTNNGNTYTVLNALSAQSGQILFCSGASSPTSSGTLTRSSGAGTASISFSAITALATYNPPANVLYLKVKMVGGGGGGAGSSASSPGSGGNGGTTALGANILMAGGGPGGTAESPGANSSASFSGSGVSGIALEGGTGDCGSINNTTAYSLTIRGGIGAASPFGGAGSTQGHGTAGSAAAPNTGSGGGGGSGYGQATWVSGAGGSAGGYIEVLVSGTTLASWLASGAPYCIGSGGSAGSGTYNGAAGGSGVILIEEHYQ